MMAAPPQRPRRLRHDLRASVQLIETMIVGLLVVSAVVMVSTLNVPVTTTEGFKRETEQLAQDSLSAPDSRPAQEPDLFGSRLEEMIMQAIAGYEKPFRDYLNRTLPAGAQYNVYLDNGHQTRLVLDSGHPPREAVAASMLVAPKLAYTLARTEFGHYHGDYPQALHVIPFKQGILFHDEGTSIELSITYHEAPLAGTPGNPVTQKTYGATALRYNDPNERAWPSTTLSLDVAGKRSYHLDAKNAPSYNGPDLPVSRGVPLITEPLYNITLPIKLEETSGEPLRKNTKIQVEYPRGWFLGYDLHTWNQQANPDWKDWTVTGDGDRGTIIQASLKTQQTGPVWFNISMEYAMLLDSAYPHYYPITANLANGAQSLSQFLVTPPGALDAGALRRDLYLSIPKPINDLQPSYWGVVFGNLGERVQIDSITLRQSDKIPILHAVATDHGTPGTWDNNRSQVTFTWTPSNTLYVPKGGVHSLSLEVTNGHTTDNHYTNMDRLPVYAYYNSTNKTGSNPDLIGPWDYEKRLVNLGGEWIYRGMVPPSDGDPVSGYWPGWPDQPLEEYWTTQAAYPYHAEMGGNTSYRVVPEGASSNTFGDYQGSHVFSDLEVTDPLGTHKRDFELGARVHIQNNFTALFGTLSAMESTGKADLGDLKIRTEIFTPEKAWTGKPTVVFEQSVYVDPYGEPKKLHVADVNKDGKAEIVLVTTTGQVYVLDGGDGAKLLTFPLGWEPGPSAVADLDTDGVPELVVGFDDNYVRAYALGLDHTGDRVVWDEVLPIATVETGLSLQVSPPLVYQIYDLLAFEGGSGPSSAPNVVATASAAGVGFVQGFRVWVDADGVWQSERKEEDRYVNTDLLRGPSVIIYDLEPVWWQVDRSGPATHVALVSDNRTASLLPRDRLSGSVWVTDLDQVPVRVVARDLDGDGIDDLIADTRHDAVYGGGTQVISINGASGNWRTKMRSAGSETMEPTKAVVGGDGTIVVLTGTKNITADTTGWVNPALVQPATVLGETSPNDWVDVQATEGGVLLQGKRGYLWESTRDSGGAVLWAKRNEGTESVPDIMGIHRDADGTLYRYDSQGSVFRYQSTTEEWTRIAIACTGFSDPVPQYQGVDCSKLEVDAWSPALDPTGTLRYVIIQLHDGSSGDPALVSYSLDAPQDETAWYQETTQTINTFTANSETIHIGTTNGIQSKPFRTAPPWKTNIINGAPATSITTLHFTNPSDGYAINNEGKAWHTGDAKTWLPLPINATTTGTYTIATTPTGHAWLLGDDFTYAPLYTPTATSNATYKLHALPDNASLVTVQSNFDVGGEFTADTTIHVDVSQDDKTWTHLNAEKKPGSVVEYALPADHTCPSWCDDVFVRFTLSNPIVQVGETFERDASVTPILHAALVDDAGEQTQIALGEPIGGSSTWSTMQNGLVSPSESKLNWVYEGKNQQTDQSRWITTTNNSVYTGTGTGHVLIVEQVLAGQELTLLHGASGRTEPFDIPGGLGTPSLVNSGDATGDGIEDFYLAGGTIAAPRGIRVWSVGANTSLDSPNQVEGALVDFADAGTGRFVFAGSLGKVALAESHLGEVKSVWATSPSQSQGHSTFHYDIPKSAFFGTGVVVSELVFKVIENGSPTTQTARVLNWFNIVNDDGRMPRPPMYNVELVAWFNEA